MPQGIKQRTSSCAVVPDGAGRPSGRRGAPSHPARPPGAPRHQAAHQLLRCRPRRCRPALRPTRRTVSSGQAVYCTNSWNKPPRSKPAAHCFFYTAAEAVDHSSDLYAAAKRFVAQTTAGIDLQGLNQLRPTICIPLPSGLLHKQLE